MTDTVHHTPRKKSMEFLRNHILRATALFLGFVMLAGIVAYVVVNHDDPLVLQKKAEYEAQRWTLKAEYLHQSFQLRTWGTIGLLTAFGVSAIIIAAGIHRAKIRAASVHVARIGDAEIPVHYRQIEQGDLSEHLAALAHAEELKQHNAGMEKAMEIHLALADYEIQRFKSLAAHTGRAAIASEPREALPAAIPIPVMTLRDLIQTGRLCPGSPIPFGHLPAPADDIISIGIAGNQGSGKSNVIAALTGSLMYAAGADAYIIDPHKGNPKALSALLTPLESTGRLHVFTPFDVAPIVEQLDRLLSDRLAGATCDPHILLVIDELPALSRSDVWGALTTLLVRLVTEARKAGITFIGASHIWTGKYFNGKSEIRKCLNSTLILPTKPSQADLLLEDSKEKALVKSLHEPGQGLLSLNMQSPELIRMPLCSADDMQTIAAKLSHRDPVLDIDSDPVLTKDQLKAGRERLGLSQEQFGQKVGLTQKKISRLESGESRLIDLDSDTLDRISDALDGKKNNIRPFPSKALAKAV